MPCIVVVGCQRSGGPCCLHDWHNFRCEWRCIYFQCHVTSSDWLADTIEENCYWEANSRSAGQEIPWALWNPKIHYRLTCPPNTRTCVTFRYTLHFVRWIVSPKPTKRWRKTPCRLYPTAYSQLASKFAGRLFHPWSRNFSLGYGLNDWGPIPCRGRGLFSSPPSPHRLWITLRLLYNVTWGSCPRVEEVVAWYWPLTSILCQV
jgi:hypothetical protein